MGKEQQENSAPLETTGNCDYGKLSGCPYFKKGCDEIALKTISEMYGRYNIDEELEKIVKIHGEEFGPNGARPRRIWKLEGRTYLCNWTNVDSRIIEWEMDMGQSFFDFPSEVRC